MWSLDDWFYSSHFSFLVMGEGPNINSGHRFWRRRAERPIPPAESRNGRNAPKRRRPVKKRYQDVKRGKMTERLPLQCSALKDFRPFSTESLKPNPDYYHGDPLVALALKFYLRGLPGLDIRQTTGFISDPNDSRIRSLERPALLPPRVVEALAPAVDRGDLTARNRIRPRRQCERAAENNRQHCLVHLTPL
jgi:hypothetical protein